MSDTVEITLSNSAWTDVSGGVAYGFFTNHSDRYITYREAPTTPVASVTTGHRLNPGDNKHWAITNGQKIWARVVPTLVGSTVTLIVTRGFGSLTNGGAVSRDFFVEVNAGNVPGHQLIHKFGSNPNVTAVKSDIWEQGGLYPWPLAAETLDVVSTDTVADILTGVGARTILIKGLDTDFVEIEETITLLATPVTTVNSYRRVQTAQVVECGAYTGENQGDITFTSSISLDILGIIKEHDGRTSQTMYTVAANKTAYMLNTSITMDTGKSISANMHIREDADIIAAPFRAEVHLHHWKGLATPVDERFFANHVMPGKTDVWFDAELLSGGSAIVGVDYDMLLVDD